MFRKILVAEDIDSIHAAVISQLDQLTHAEIHQAKYCDEAYLKVKKALLDGEPYDLLITDLSFKQDHRDTVLESGEDLITSVKETQPEIKVIAYSIEDRSYKIKALFEECGINGYVSKGREGSKELEKAVIALAGTTENYVPAPLSNIFQANNIIEIEEYDLKLIKYLSIGLTQDEIGAKFKKQGNVPSSNSSIEKRINKLKLYFKAKNTIHLISNAKDLGLI